MRSEVMKREQESTHGLVWCWCNWFGPSISPCWCLARVVTGLESSRHSLHRAVQHNNMATSTSLDLMRFVAFLHAMAMSHGPQSSDNQY